MSQENTMIHEAVREHYGSIARSRVTADPDLNVRAADCCSGSVGEADCGCGPQGLYDEHLLAGLPVDVTGLSMGCGDPVTIASLRPGETVLDLGSGGGIDCFLAARQVGERGHVIGVDMTPDMIAKADANKVKIGLGNVEFRQGQIEALPVDDNSIDVVMSNCVINLSPDKPAVFREAFRVLRPGGRIAISDVVTEGDFSDALRADLASWPECLAGAIDADRYMGMMRKAGFVDVQVVDKVAAEPIIERQEGMPRVFSARITGRKPA
jgi:arsenite methyltransferase